MIQNSVIHILHCRSVKRCSGGEAHIWWWRLWRCQILRRLVGATDWRRTLNTMCLLSYATKCLIRTSYSEKNWAACSRDCNMRNIITALYDTNLLSWLRQDNQKMLGHWENRGFWNFHWFWRSTAIMRVLSTDFWVLSWEFFPFRRKVEISQPSNEMRSSLTKGSGLKLGSLEINSSSIRFGFFLLRPKETNTSKNLNELL